MLHQATIGGAIQAASDEATFPRASNSAGSEGEAARARQQLRTFGELSVGIVYRLRLQPRIEVEYVNDLLEDITGFTPNEYQADPDLFRRRVSPDDRVLLDLIQSTHPSATGGRITYRMQRRDGTWIWIEDHYVPERDEDGEVVAIQGLAFDVSARHELEQARDAALEHEREAAEHLRRTVSMQRSFLQAISHEFRTPLTAVVGFARTLQAHLDQLSGGDVDRLTTRLLRNAEWLEGLLGDLLDIDRLTRGVVQPHFTRAELGDICRNVVEGLSLSTHQVALDIHEVQAPFDVSKVERIIEGLLHNAARHTPAGTTVSLRTRDHGDHVTITVEDDGPGVPPELVDRLFEPFSQGLLAAESPSPGTGIGLAIVARFAELHDGEARYEPQPDGGARFVVELSTQLGERSDAAQRDTVAEREHARDG